MKLAARQPSFRRLVGIYLFGRVGMDLIGAMLILYFARWLGRTDDFEPTMAFFFVVVIASLPVWVRLAPTPARSRPSS